MYGGSIVRKCQNAACPLCQVIHCNCNFAIFILLITIKQGTHTKHKTPINCHRVLAGSKWSPCSIGPCMIVAHALLSRLSSSDASFSWTKCILRVINPDNASHAWQKPNITSRVLFYVNIFDNHATSCISRGKISFSAEQSASYALTTQIMYLTRNKNQTSPDASISLIITQPLASLAKNIPHLMW